MTEIGRRQTAAIMRVQRNVPPSNTPQPCCGIPLSATVIVATMGADKSARRGRHALPVLPLQLVQDLVLEQEPCFVLAGGAEESRLEDASGAAVAQERCLEAGGAILGQAF